MVLTRRLFLLVFIVQLVINLYLLSRPCIHPPVADRPLTSNFVPTLATPPSNVALIGREKTHFFMIIVIPDRSWDRFRTPVRKTWLRYNNIWHPTRNPSGTVRYFFLVGEKDLSEVEKYGAHKENEEFGDIMFLDAINTDFGPKFVKFLQWLSSPESKITYDFILKTDSDSFVRTELLETELRQLAQKEGIQLYDDKSSQTRRGEDKALYYGARMGLHNRELCKHSWEKLDMMAGAAVVISRPLVEFMALNPALPDTLRYCRHREDLRTASWVRYFMEYHNGTLPLKPKKHYKTLVHSTPSISLTPSQTRGPEFRKKPLVVHTANLKDHVPDIFDFLFQRWPPGSTFTSRFSWDEFDQLLYSKAATPAGNADAFKTRELDIWTEKVKKMMKQDKELMLPKIVAIK